MRMLPFDTILNPIIREIKKANGYMRKEHPVTPSQTPANASHAMSLIHPFNDPLMSTYTFSITPFQYKMKKCSEHR